MRTKITDNWEVELTNDRGDTLTLKGEWHADFFKEYDNKQLIIANVVGQSEQLVCYYKYHNRDITTNGECTKCESHKWR